MDTTTLQTPRTGGRSRFSKALPMPPAPQDTAQATSPIFKVPRKLPDLPNLAASTPFTSRKDIVDSGSSPKPQNLPFPALPAKPSVPEVQKKMPPIPRKAVASPPAVGSVPPPAQPSYTESVDKQKLKRVSSISSLLSAYSNTSSDSVHRSSQGSSVTKGSEASLSPEREAVQNGARENGAAVYKAYSRSPYEEPSPEEKEVMMHEPLPPPPPMKDAGRSSRPTTPLVGLPSTPRPGTVAPPKVADDAQGQTTLLGSSPPRREIWRRRASSKSDRSIAVAQLNLAVSNGSSAATTMMPAPSRASQESLPDPLMSKSNENANRVSPLPPRTSSALPGRNVKPLPQQHEAVATAPAPKSSQDLTAPKSDSVPSSVKPARADMSTASPLSSPEPPAKSLRRREVGSKPSTQNMRGQEEANPAQHLRQARSAISLRAEAERSERVHREVAQNKFPEELQHLHESHPAVPSPRARRPSNPAQAPRLAAAPQLTVTSPTARAAPREPVEYKDQVPMQLTAQEEKNLLDAISKVVNREHWNWTPVAPNKHGVWPCKELTSDHLTCLSDHKRWIHMENFNVPIACMLCHEGQQEHRRVCKSCGIRVCIGCADLLTGRKIEELDFDALANKTKEKELAVATH